MWYCVDRICCSTSAFRYTPLYANYAIGNRASQTKVLPWFAITFEKPVLLTSRLCCWREPLQICGWWYRVSTIIDLSCHSHISKLEWQIFALHWIISLLGLRTLGWVQNGPFTDETECWAPLRLAWLGRLIGWPGPQIVDDMMAGEGQKVWKKRGVEETKWKVGYERFLERWLVNNWSCIPKGKEIKTTYSTACPTHLVVPTSCWPPFEENR